MIIKNIMGTLIQFTSVTLNFVTLFCIETNIYNEFLKNIGIKQPYVTVVLVKLLLQDGIKSLDQFINMTYELVVIYVVPRLKDVLEQFSFSQQLTLKIHL